MSGNYHNQKLARVRYDDTYFKHLVADALEAGLAHPDAARLAAAVFKEVDIAARDENNNHNLLPPTALEDIRLYCRAILRSGTTFSAWEVAKRAVGAWRDADDELNKLHAEWRKEMTRAKVHRQYVRRKARESMVMVDGDGVVMPYQHPKPLPLLGETDELPDGWIPETETGDDDRNTDVEYVTAIDLDDDTDLDDDDEVPYLDFDFYRQAGIRRQDQEDL